VDVSTGNVQQVTDGEYDVTAPSWSPDGRAIAFSSNTSPRADATTDRHIYVVSLDEGDPKQITPSQGPLTNPTWSPDGEWIAFFGSDNKCDRAGNTGVWVVRPNGEDLTDLTSGWEYTAGSTLVSDMHFWGAAANGPTWLEDSCALLFEGTVGGSVGIFKVPADGSAAVTGVVHGNFVVTDYDYSPTTRKIAATISTPTRPSELFVCGLDNDSMVQITSLNEWLDDVEVPKAERFQCAGDGGVPVEGWMIKPPSFDSRKKYPMILEIHGGSHLTFGWTFFHEFHVLASAGYVVVFTNPRGSQGYGEEFSASIRHDWGGKEYRDLMHVVDYVVDMGIVDEKRLGVTGGSFGGYMTNWIIGQTERFSAAVTDRCTSNRYSNWGTSDWGWLNGVWEWPGAPWESSEFYLERSPISYVDKISTPLLIIHSDSDHRCAIEQAEQLFTALKWLDKEVQWVLFGGEGHDLSRSGKPANRLERLHRIVDWFDRHLS
jgi:dipeptidyl aminopeptidase/acylaminoacyl peptidase